jgi:hypothetical protein
MKLNTRTNLLLLAIILPLAIICGPLAAQVYKVVDKDGNVTYTDQPPKDGSKPIELGPISIIEAPDYEIASPPDAASKGDEEVKEKSLRFLRKLYQDFAIVSPKQEESVWYSDNVVAVAWNSPNPLEPGMQVTVSVDGAAQPPTSERVIAVTGLERGEHTIMAELKDSKNRRVATAVPVTFFIRQPNIYMNAPRPTPQGPG